MNEAMVSVSRPRKTMSKSRVQSMAVPPAAAKRSREKYSARMERSSTVRTERTVVAAATARRRSAPKQP
jgi:hypothetical protein